MNMETRNENQKLLELVVADAAFVMPVRKIV
jgi:hypothetical protein